MNEKRKIKPSSFTRHDAQLISIPMIFVGGIFIGTIFSIPISLAIGGSAVFSFLPLFDALFNHPPLDTEQRTQPQKYQPHKMHSESD